MERATTTATPAADVRDGGRSLRGRSAQDAEVAENTRKRRIMQAQCRDLLEGFMGSGMTWNGQSRAAIAAAFWRGYELAQKENKR